MKQLFVTLLFTGGILFSSVISAHHSFAIYDFNTQIPFVGVIKTIKFRNPHIAMTLIHTRDDGTTEIINFPEGAPANMLARLGLRPNMVKPGTRITAVGSPSKEDPNRYFLRKIILENGKEFSPGP